MMRLADLDCQVWNDFDGKYKYCAIKTSTVKHVSYIVSPKPCFLYECGRP